MSWLGKLIAAPIRIANVPFIVADKLMDEMCGTESDQDALAPGRTIADAIEEAVDEIVDGTDE